MSSVDNLKTPVILVSGSFNSGKTSFIQSISGIEPTAGEMLEKVRLPSDAGKITLGDDLAVYFAAPPDRHRVNVFWDVAQYLMGSVIVVDSTKPAEFREALTLLYTSQAYFPIPYVVAANKQDHLDAWKPEEIRNALNVPEEIPVVPCIATDKESVKNVLITLLYKVLEAIETPDDGLTTIETPE